MYHVHRGRSCSSDGPNKQDTLSAPWCPAAAAVTSVYQSWTCLDCHCSSGTLVPLVHHLSNSQADMWPGGSGTTFISITQYISDCLRYTTTKTILPLCLIFLAYYMHFMSESSFRCQCKHILYKSSNYLCWQFLVTEPMPVFPSSSLLFTLHLHSVILYLATTCGSTFLLPPLLLASQKFRPICMVIILLQPVNWYRWIYKFHLFWWPGDLVDLVSYCFLKFPVASDNNQQKWPGHQKTGKM